MRRTISVLVSVTICLLSAFVPNHFIFATADSSSASVTEHGIWTDDFSENSIDRYTVTGPDNGIFGDWQVSGGLLRVTGTSAASNWWTTTSLLDGVNYENFVMEFDAEVSTGYGVVFRGQDDGKTAGTGFNTWYGGNTYVLMHHNPADASSGEYMALYDFNGEKTLIKSFGSPGTMGALKKVHWILTANENNIIVNVSNSEGEESYTYSIENIGYSNGSIGFYNTTRSGVTSLKIDNLTVTPINNIYENDFSDSKTIDDFYTAGPDSGEWGTWQIADSHLQVTGNTGAKWWGSSLISNEKYDNFVMEFDAESTAGYGLIFRAGNKEELNTWYGGDGYCAMHWNPTNSSNGRYTELYDYSGKESYSCIYRYCDEGGMASMSSMHWKVVAWNGIITVEISDNSSDSSYIYTVANDKYKAGYIGFYSLTYAGNTSLKIDNLTIDGYKIKNDNEEILSGIWTDDFSENSIDRYTVTGPDNGIFGDWQVSGGLLRVTGTSAASNWWTTTSLLDGVNYENFVMEFDAEVSTGYGVVFRGQDDGKTAGTGFNTWYGGNTYVLMHHNPADASSGEYMALYDFNGEKTLIKSFGSPGTMGALKKVHWILTANENNIIVNVSNSEGEESYTYSIENIGYSNGSIGFYNTTRSGVTSLKIDNLTVTPINNIYENDFSDSKTIDDFYTAGPDSGEWGTWQIADSHLQVTGNTGAKWWGSSLISNEKYDNFVMEFDAESTAGYGLIFRAGNKEELNTWYGGDGYCAMHWNPTNSSNGRYTELYDYSGKESYSCIYRYCDEGGMASMSSMHWKVVAWNGIITVEISDNSSDSSYIYTVANDKYKAGYIGFYSLTYAGNTSLKIDNLTIDGYVSGINFDPDINEDNNNFTVCDSIWSDDFQTDTISFYKVTGAENGEKGSWRIADGRLTLNGNNAGSMSESAIMLKDRAYDNFVMEFDVKATSGYGVFFRAQDNADIPDKGLNSKNDGKTYRLGISASDGCYAIDLLKQSGVEIILGRKELDTVSDDAHWKLIADENNIYIIITDNKTGKTVSADFTNSNYSLGMLGFYGSVQNNQLALEIDNLIITPVSKSLYSNDFSDNSALDDFIIAGPENGIFGKWETVDGLLQVTGTEAAESWWGTSIVTKELFSDYVLEFDAIVSSGYGIFFRTADDASIEGYGLNQWYGGNGYAMMHWNPSDASSGRYTELYDYAGNGKQRFIQKFHNVGEMSSLTNVHWKIIAWGSTIIMQVSSNIDTDIVYTYILNDETYYSGRVGFYNLTHSGVTSLKIDNMSIRGMEYGTQPEFTKYKTEDFIFKDDFSSNKSEFYTSYGSWYANTSSDKTGTSYEGVLGNEGNSKTGYNFYYYNEMLTNFTMEFDVKASKSSEYGVMLRAGTRGYSQYTGDGYLINLSGQSITCGKVYGVYEPVRIGDYSYTVPDNIAVSHWKVVCSGDGIQLFINHSDEPVISVKDDSFTIGYVGLRVQGSETVSENAVFDNLVISGRRYVSGITSSNYASSRGNEGIIYDYYNIPETAKKTNKIR